MRRSSLAPPYVGSSGQAPGMTKRRDYAALALLARFPLALQVAVQDHVHALEDEALRLVGKGDDALAAQDARPLALGELVDPRHEDVRVHLARVAHGDRLHLLVVMVVM